jgi:hypothetical protein
VVALDGGGVWAFVQFVALVSAPTLALAAALRAGQVARWVGRRRDDVWPRGRRRGDVPPGPPLERIVADLHRIAAQIATLPPRAPYARRQGAILAYDDVLGAACRALGVDDELRGLPFGTARDVARIRVEAELARAGLVLDEPRAA